MKLVRLHVISEHSGAVYGLCAGAGGRTFFSASADRYVAEWDLTTMRQTKTAIQLEDHGYVVLRDEKRDLLLIGCSDGSLHLIDLVKKVELRKISFHTKGIFDVAMDHTTSRLYMAGGDGILSVWEFPGMELVRAIPLSSEKLRQISIHPHESIVGIASGDGMVRILEMKEHNEIASIDAHRDGVTSLAWHPYKPVLLTGGRDAMLRVWNTGENYREILALPAHRYAIYSILFDEKRDAFFTGSRDGSIKAWNSSDLSVLQKIELRDGGHSHSVNKLALVGDLLLSAGDDRKIIVWQIANS